MNEKFGEIKKFKIVFLGEQSGKFVYFVHLPNISFKYLNIFS